MTFTRTLGFLILFTSTYSSFGQVIPSTSDFETKMFRNFVSHSSMKDSNFNGDNQSKITQQVAISTINEESYIIGTGDVFFISLVDAPNINYTTSVDQNNNLYIPDLGLVTIGRTNLVEAKERITAYMKAKLRQAGEIYVALLKPKDVSVSFLGAIASPGTYRLPGPIKLFDAIKTAHNGEVPSFSEADLRNVTVSNTDQTKQYDLMAFLHKDDHEQNPYITPGDMIRISPLTKQVYINGAVREPKPSVYPLRKNETISEFLSHFVLDRAADTLNISVHRIITGEIKERISYYNDLVLQHLDVITIPVKKNHPRVFHVSISGQAARPGTYPIIEDVTTASDIINLAGGTTATGNLTQAVIIRHGKSLSPEFSMRAQPIAGVRPELGTSLTMMSATSDHIVISLNEQGHDVVLEPNDQVYIPKMEKFVYVSGNVKQPGAYEYIRGQNNAYYIRQAGGLSRNADRSNIKTVMRYGEVYQLVDSGEVQPGNIVVVPASIQYRFFSTVFIPLVSAIATTLGVGLAIYNTAR